MSQQTGDRIVREVMSKPHVRGTRVDVLTIYDRVNGAGLDPETVAERHGLDVADVYHALAYYHDNVEEMQELREEESEAFEEFKERADRNRPDHVDVDS